jgi:uncharacterized membrane protein
MKRLFYVDVLRGLAILFMVIDHAFDWWMDSAGHSNPFANYTKFIGTLAAPLFLFLVGLGLALWYDREKHKGETVGKINLNLIRRGFVIFLWGYLLNLLVFYVGNNTQDLLAIDVLQTIGLSIWLVIPLLGMPIWFIVLLYLGLATIGQTAASWTVPNWLAPFVTGQSGIGYFPLALWFPYACLGLAFGKTITGEQQPKNNMLSIVLLGLVSLLIIPLINPNLGYRHPRPIFVLFSIAFIFWLTALTWFWTDYLAKRGPVVHALQIMGRASLWIYVIHHLIGYRLFWLLGWVNGRSWRGEYGTFSPLLAAVLLLGLVSIMILGSQWWLAQRSKFRKLQWTEL